MFNAILMNTTLFDKSVPLAGNVSVVVKANSSKAIKLTSRGRKFLEANLLTGIKISYSSVVEDELGDTSSEEVEEEVEVKEEDKVEDEVKEEEEGNSEEVPFNLDDLDSDTARELCHKLGIKVRNNTSLGNMKAKLSEVDPAKLAEVVV